jgi:hypothetical protein
MRASLAWRLDAASAQKYGPTMRHPSRELDREKDEADVMGEAAPPAPAPAVQPGSMEWASAVGNQAVQRLARQSVAREAVAEEEEEMDEEGGEAAPAVQAGPEGGGAAGGDGAELEEAEVEEDEQPG